MVEFLCPIIAVAFNALTQILAFRMRRGDQYFRSIVEGIGAGFLVLIPFECFLFVRSISPWSVVLDALLVDVPIYLALSYCFYSFVQLGQTSIRIRMFSEIASHPDGITIAEMQRQYSDESLLRVRLRRLVEGGDLIEREGRYFVGRKRFLHVANALFAAKRILLGKASQFQ
jgi:hypothetical protein